MKFLRFLMPLLFAGILSTAFVSCAGEDDDNSSNGTQQQVDLAAARADLASNIANQLIIPALEAIAPLSDDLVTAVDAFAQAPNETNLANAQGALKNVWQAWQAVAIYQFGPAESLTLRKSLNTYPTDEDQIEQNVLSGDYILGSLDNADAVGLPAIDYLLNSEDAATVIELFSSAETGENRKNYLTDLVVVVDEKLDASLEGWIASGGNYVDDFTSEAARGTDVGSALGIIVNAIDLHFQRFTRDGKLAIPAGVRSAGVPRPTTTEAFYGGYSVELLIASLQAYQRLYMGLGVDDRDGMGLYDYLVLLEANELADDIQAQFQTTIDKAAGLQDPLSNQIETDLDAILDVFIEMQNLVPLLKSDMASIMGVAITNQDNDGD